MHKSIAVGVIGATGYTGIELVRILSLHPNVELKYLISESYSTYTINNIYPHLTNVIELELIKLDISQIIDTIDLVFLALPHGKYPEIAKELIDKGKRIIDLSANWRLRDAKVFQKWYLEEIISTTLLDSAIYGLPEIGNYAAIQTTNLLANPGCYSTASILGLAPLVSGNLIDLNSIIIDAKSGVSGAGRSLQLQTNYCEVNESFAAYQIGGVHRHIPEIEQELSRLAKTPILVHFTPHLVPMARGILATIYVKPIEKLTSLDLYHCYTAYYANSKFIRLNNSHKRPQTKQVRGTNYCDINLYLDERTNQIIIIAVIDNLLKGAAGQAVQNLNIMYSLPEETGLNHIAIYP